MRTLSWADFDRALDSAVARLASCSLSGVYGVPRGGLVLAVCLSHRLGIPLLEQPQAGCLVVDDIYETCLLYTSPSPRDVEESRMPSSA